jgi:hypothetical protein
VGIYRQPPQPTQLTPHAPQLNSGKWGDTVPASLSSINTANQMRVMKSWWFKALEIENYTQTYSHFLNANTTPGGDQPRPRGAFGGYLFYEVVGSWYNRPPELENYQQGLRIQILSVPTNTPPFTGSSRNTYNMYGVLDVWYDTTKNYRPMIQIYHTAEASFIVTGANLFFCNG